MGSLDLHNTFSCTDPAVTQEVPMLHGKVHLLPICGCPVQTKISTSSLSKGDGTGCGSFETTEVSIFAYLENWVIKVSSLLMMLDSLQAAASLLLDLSIRVMVAV